MELLNKGTFVPINDVFVRESLCALEPLAELQNKYEKSDMDTLLNEIHDSIVGRYLGFGLINTEKHGFDCKYSENQNIFLESKVASYSAKTFNATFNDTNQEKADAFKSDNVWLALSIWENATSLICICYGQNKEIGEYLEERMNSRPSGSRSTQSVSIKNLVFRYNFRILSVKYSKEELLSKLVLYNARQFQQLNLDKIDTLNTFRGII